MALDFDKKRLRTRLLPLVFVAAVLISALVAQAPVWSAPSALQAEHLKCEWKQNPVGIDALHPHFSWTLKAIPSTARGAKQSAYQIIVSASATRLPDDRGEEWDSGKISSSQMIQVEYRGKPLVTATHYYWKLRVWDQSDHLSPWSDVAEFTTALLGANEWKARWISADPDMPLLPQARENIAIPDQAVKPLPIFRHEFSPTKKLAQAIIFISGLGQYELHINAQNVTGNVLTPGWTSYRKRVSYDSYDVTNFIRLGRNAIGILLGNGMYNVPAADGRYTKFVGSFGLPKVILQMHLKYVDGTTEIIVSDKNWKTSPGPITFSNVYGGEDYDAGREQVGWDMPGFADANWQPVQEVRGPGGELSAGQAPPIKVMCTYESLKSTRPAPNVRLYDLGQNISGWPEITVRGTGGSSVKIIAGELLDSSGLVTQHSANASPQSENRFTYTLRGGGNETWHPRFSTYGFRYVQVESIAPFASTSSRAPEIVSLKGQFIHDDAAAVGTFQTSDHLFGQIHQLIDMAILSNMVSVLTDCPHREKLGWLEQTHLAGPSILFNYDAITLYQKMAQDMRDSQLPNGLVPAIAPEYVAFVDESGANTDFRDSPEWGSAAILSPWSAYQFYGDKNLLALQYDAMKAYAAFLKGKADNNLLAYGLGDWYDIGPGPPGKSQLTGKELTATAFYFEDLIVLSKVAAIVGDSTDAATYASESAHIKDAFNAKLFHVETEQYDRGSQTANAIPLVLGMVPAGHDKGVLQHLVDDIRQHGNHVTAGDIGFHYVVRALTDGGRSDVLYDMLSRTDSPSYGYQLARGATTLTEAWDTNPNSSQNHFMLGHAEEWFYRGLAGVSVDFDRPEAERIAIRPIPVGDIASASATYDSVLGEIRTSWTHQATHFTLHVAVPPNSSALIEIPASVIGSVTESGGALNQASGILDVRVTDHGVACRVSSGEYTFHAEL